MKALRLPRCSSISGNIEIFSHAMKTEMQRNSVVIPKKVSNHCIYERAVVSANVLSAFDLKCTPRLCRCEKYCAIFVMKMIKLHFASVDHMGKHNRCTSFGNLILVESIFPKIVCFLHLSYLIRPY